MHPMQNACLGACIVTGSGLSARNGHSRICRQLTAPNSVHWQPALRSCRWECMPLRLERHRQLHTLASACQRTMMSIQQHATLAPLIEAGSLLSGMSWLAASFHKHMHLTGKRFARMLSAFPCCDICCLMPLQLQQRSLCHKENVLHAEPELSQICSTAKSQRFGTAKNVAGAVERTLQCCCQWCLDLLPRLSLLHGCNPESSYPAKGLPLLQKFEVDPRPNKCRDCTIVCRALSASLAGLRCRVANSI